MSIKPDFLCFIFYYQLVEDNHSLLAGAEELQGKTSEFSELSQQVTPSQTLKQLLLLKMCKNDLSVMSVTLCVVEMEGSHVADPGENKVPQLGSECSF